MSKFNFFIIISIFCSVTCYSANCAAAPYHFSGTVYDLYGLPADTDFISIGDTFTGTFSYQLLMDDPPGWYGEYEAGYDVAISYSLCFDNFTITRSTVSPGGQFIILENDADSSPRVPAMHDTFSIYSMGDFGVAAEDYSGPYAAERPGYSGRGFYFDDLYFAFYDTTPSAFSDLSLPESIDPSAFDMGWLHGIFILPGGYEDCGFQASIDNFYSKPVPEPSTVILLGTGLVGLVGAARKRFRR